jgi:hypothetical protein
VAPWTLARLVAVLSSSQCEFEVFTEAEPTSSSMNLAGGCGAPWARRGGAAAAAEVDGGVDGERGDVGIAAAEAAAWLPGCQQLGGRYVKQLRFSNAVFSAKLGAP